MRNLSISAKAILPIMLLSLFSCKTKDKKTIDTDIAMPVSVAYPQVDSVVLRNSYPGYLSAHREVALVARVNGTVTGVFFHDGDQVKEGQLLFTIEDTQYQDAVKQAQATLETAIATNEYNTNQYNAMKKALESDAVSTMDVLEAKSNMEESMAQIENARAALKTATTTLGYCRVTAPFNGKMALSSVSLYDYVNGAASPVKLNTIYNDDMLHATFSIEESLYLKMLDNEKKEYIDLQHVPVKFSEPLPHNYTGNLAYTSPQIDTSTGTLTLRLDVENPYGELKSGMYVTVDLPYSVVKDAILIKDAAIGTDQLGKYVYVVNDSNNVVYTPIEVGELYNDTLRIVTSGLSKNSKYVTEALLKVKDGMKVKPELTSAEANKEPLK